MLNLIWSGVFSPENPQLFVPVVDTLISRDDFMVLADYDNYMECQKKVEEAWKNQDKWQRMSILNMARMGKFSSDRAIAEYCSDIWKVEPVSVELDIIKSD